MPLDFTKETKGKVCCKCNKQIINGVCVWYVVHITDDGEEYQCWDCWKSDEVIALERERYAREVLERVLRNGR